MGPLTFPFFLVVRGQQRHWVASESKYSSHWNFIWIFITRLNEHQQKCQLGLLQTDDINKSHTVSSVKMPAQEVGTRATKGLRIKNPPQTCLSLREPYKKSDKSTLAFFWKALLPFQPQRKHPPISSLSLWGKGELLSNWLSHFPLSPPKTNVFSQLQSSHQDARSP